MSEEKQFHHGEHGDTAEKQCVRQEAPFSRWVSFRIFVGVLHFAVSPCPPWFK